MVPAKLKDLPDDDEPVSLTAALPDTIFKVVLSTSMFDDVMLKLLVKVYLRAIFEVSVPVWVNVVLKV